MDWFILGLFILIFILLCLAPWLGREDRPEFKRPDDRPKRKLP